MASSKVSFLLGIAFILYLAPAVAPSLTENIPFHVALSWAMFVFFAATWKGYLHPLRTLSKLEIIALIIPIIMMIFYKLVTETTEDYWGIRVYWILTGIMLAISASAIFSHARSRNIFLKFMLFAGFATALVSILQYINIHSFLWSWTRYSELGLVYGTAGLDNNTVKFGYSIVGISTIVGCSVIAYVQRIKLLPISKFLFFIISLVIFSGVLVSGSRSAILGTALGTLCFAWFIVKNKDQDILKRRVAANTGNKIKSIDSMTSSSSKIAEYNYSGVAFSQPPVPLTALKIYNFTKNRSQILILSIFISAALLIVAVTTREGIEDDARFGDTWKAYVPIIAANVFGNAIDLNKYIDLIDADSLYNLTSQNRRSEPIWPHNIILTTGLIIGLPGIFSIFTIYYVLFKRALLAAKKARLLGMHLEEMWLLALIASNIGVLTHCWYHNGNILLGEMRNWIWIGALWGLTSCVTSKSKSY